MKKYIPLILLVIFTLSTNLSAQWFDITPKNVGENLYSVYFTNSDTGFVVGWGSSRSLFMKTFDGGTTWDIQNFVGIYLFNVTAKNGKEIFLSGFTTRGLCGIVWNSSDGGKNFTEIQFDDLSNPFSYGIMNFLRKDDTSYFAIGYNGAIIYSENSGTTWKAADTKSPDEIFRYITFPTHEIGYAASGANFNFINKIYKTTNWGDSWIKIQDFTNGSTYINNLYFLSDKVGFIAGNNQSKESILKTTDGGITWLEIYSGDALNSITTMFFENPQVIYAINDEGKIIKTENGGENWSVYRDNQDFQLITSQGMTQDSNFIAYGVGAGLIKKFAKIVDVQELSDNSNFDIYPNPVRDLATIKIPELYKTEQLKITITDILGRTVYEKQDVFLDYFAFNTFSLPSGTYFYRVFTQTALLKSGKFIK